MSTEQMRAVIRDAYPGDKWHYKVDHMSESQVIAVYLALKGQGKV